MAEKSAWQTQRLGLLAQREHDKREIERLTKLIAALREKLFGTGQGEKVDHAQLEMELRLAELEMMSLHGGGEEASNEGATPQDKEEIDGIIAGSNQDAKEPTERVKRFSLPDDVEERTERIIPAEVQANPEDYNEIGEPEVTNFIDLEPAKFIKIKQVFPRYVRKDDRSSAPITAPRPPRVLLGGLASVRLLVHVILAKYLEHMPLHRMEQSFRMRYNVHISRKTMGGWIRHVAEDWLLLIYESIKSDIRNARYLQVDETPITCLDRDSAKGSRKGYLWVYLNREGQCLYEWHMGRSRKCAESMLSGYRGLLQSDAYAVYSALSALEGFLQVACMAHVRRKFHDAWRHYDERPSGWYIREISKLYKIERELKENPDLDTVATRLEKSLPIMELIKSRLDADLLKLDPITKTFEAAKYTVKIWTKLCRYLYYADAVIDNNAAERAVRPTKIGMKNWLFVGHPVAGQRTAILYTIIQNCKNYDVDPQAYLEDVLNRLPNIKANDSEGIRGLQPKFWSQKS